MMINHVLIAIDSLKGSATSQEIGTWIQEGLLSVNQSLDSTVIPIADGGEGTLDALISAQHGQVLYQKVQGPFGEPTMARIAMLDPETAVIEMAEVSGLTLTQQSEHDALFASTFGVGQLMLAAARKGAHTIYLGLGGSGTTDGGAGMAQAIGVTMVDAQGQNIPHGAIGLSRLAHIEVNTRDPIMDHVAIKILSDVQNPLTGPTGTASIFGPQKGLTEKNVNVVDGWLQQYDRLIEAATGYRVGRQPGAGAAGGLGAGLLAFTHARMTSGIDEILRLVGFDNMLCPGTLVITGEGRLDSQSAAGKAPVGIARRAKAHGLPVIAVVGSRSADIEASYAAGIDVVLPLTTGPQSLEMAIMKTRENAHVTGDTIARLVGLMTQDTYVTLEGNGEYS